jgi:ActR/RegA family two-component response regulator
MEAQSNEYMDSDDEINLANGLKRAFEKSGYSAKTAKTLSELNQLLGAEIPRLYFWTSGFRTATVSMSFPRY